MRAFFEIVARRRCRARLSRTLTYLFKTCPALGSVPSNFGQELVRGLLNSDPTLAVPSSSVAASLIRGSTRAKDYILQLPVEAAPGTNGPHRLVLQTLSTTVSSYFNVQGAHFASPHVISPAAATIELTHTNSIHCRWCARETRASASHGSRDAFGRLARGLPQGRHGAPEHSGMGRYGERGADREVRQTHVERSAAEDLDP